VGMWIGRKSVMIFVINAGSRVGMSTPRSGGGNVTERCVTKVARCLNVVSGGDAVSSLMMSVEADVML